eukprot:756808-Hanusia_phi.AAC.2
MPDTTSAHCILEFASCYRADHCALLVAVVGRLGYGRVDEVRILLRACQLASESLRNATAAVAVNTECLPTAPHFQSDLETSQVHPYLSPPPSTADTPSPR